MKYIATVTTVDSQQDITQYELEINHENQVIVNGESYVIDQRDLPKVGFLSLLINSQSHEGVIESQGKFNWDVLIKGELYQVSVQDEREYRLAQARGELDDGTGPMTLKSPMPGVILAVPVAEGQAVEKGDTLVILESMKMENELKAKRAGTVGRISVSAGDPVEKDAVLLIVAD